jgi:hypothetical protein
MSADQRQNLLYILRETQRMGFENAPEEYRQLLASSNITAGFAQREAFKFGQTDPIFAEIQKLLGEDSLKKVSDDLKKLNKDIAQADDERQENFRKTIKESTDEFTTKVAAIIVETYNNLAEDINRKVKQSKILSTPPT